MKRGTAAWAGMLIAGEESWIARGVLDRRIKDTSYCELVAVGRALHQFCSHGGIKLHDRLTVFSDNEVVVRLLNGGWTPDAADKPLCAAYAHVDHTVEKYRLAVKYRWVPSHQGEFSKDWRCLINARVDREARQRAKQAAHELENPPVSEAAE